ncbi:MAG TPA: immunoglobulin domain-containing protein, partial [Clostridia bacterium]|nr:immunoglobulin domain-containing protein [Clostridia bacterium]
MPLTQVMVFSLFLCSALPLCSQPVEGRVVVWGNNDYKQAVVPPGLTHVTAVAVGTSHCLALKKDGTIAGWGTEWYGEVSQSSALSNVVAVAAGDHFSFVLKADGTAQAWGSNNRDQSSVPPGLSNVVAIAAGNSFCVALKRDGTVSAWGVGGYTSMNAPTNLTNVVAIAAGADHALALRADGTLVSWGDNSYHQTEIPASATNVVAVAGGARSSLALKADGSLVAWGNNSYGQTAVPPGATNIIGIAAGAFHSLALRSDQSIIAWGWSGGTNVPSGLTNAFAVAAGGQSSVALVNDSVSLVAYHPRSRFVYSGNSPSLLSGFAGAAQASYQWTFNGANLSGATNAVLKITDVQETNAGNYAVTVSNAYFTNASSNLVLTVITSKPIVLEHPTNQVSATGSQVIFSVSADGSLPMTYQWRFEGTNVDGATNSVLLLPSVEAGAEGKYDVVCMNAFGSATSSSAFLEVLDLNEALGATNLTWVSDGDAAWYSQGNVTHDGLAAAQSGAISGSQRSTLRTIVTGPGTLNFWWSVEAGLANNYLAFVVDGVEQFRISGFTGWQRKTVYLREGEHRLEWVYVKNDMLGIGWDAGWLDQVSFVAGGTPPLLTSVPQGQVVILGSRAVLSVAALGTPPLSYQWQLNGTNLDGATNSQWTIPAAQFTNQGLYAVVVSNQFGFTNTTPCLLDVVDFAEALNSPSLEWKTSGDRPWILQTYGAHDGVAALQTGFITHNQRSTLETTVNGPGTLTFWWQVASETNNDFVCFSIDGLEQARISGAVTWQQQRYYLTPGPHTLSWVYSKNATVSQLSDRALLDEVRFVGGTTRAFIESHPKDQAVPLSANATFTVGARGTPPLNYQWCFNKIPIFGATNAVLAVPNVQVADIGTYSVIVTNDYGSGVSTSAKLELLSLYAWGNPNKVPTNVTSIKSISAGGGHSLALRGDGQIVAWGYASYGETNVPANLVNVAAVSAGRDHNLVLHSNGTVSVWGSSEWGQKYIPPEVRDVAAISAGYYHSLALRSNGTVVAWGAGSLGDHWYSVGQSKVPANLAEVTAVAAGGFHSLALRKDGTVVA